MNVILKNKLYQLSVENMSACSLLGLLLRQGVDGTFFEVSKTYQGSESRRQTNTELAI